MRLNGASVRLAGLDGCQLLDAVYWRLGLEAILAAVDCLAVRPWAVSVSALGICWGDVWGLGMSTTIGCLMCGDDRLDVGFPPSSLVDATYITASSGRNPILPVSSTVAIC